MALFPRIYDTLLEPLIRSFRRTGLDLAAPRPGWRVLDLGCGTGTHLALYREAGCEVAGVDLNPAMVARAASRLGPGADVREADATALPFGDGEFDLAIVMLMLHELDTETRLAVVGEMRRVAGRLLLIDHRPGHDGSVLGRVVRTLTTGIERIAGGDHYRNYREFLSGGGVDALAAAAGLSESAAAEGGPGTMGIHLFG